MTLFRALPRSSAPSRRAYKYFVHIWVPLWGTPQYTKYTRESEAGTTRHSGGAGSHGDDGAKGGGPKEEFTSLAGSGMGPTLTLSRNRHRGVKCPWGRGYPMKKTTDFNDRWQSLLFINGRFFCLGKIMGARGLGGPRPISQR